MPLILHILDSLARCGAATQLTQLVDCGQRDEFEMRVVALDGGAWQAELEQRGVPVLAGHRQRFDLSLWGQLRRLIRDAQPAIVHAWSLRALDFAAAAIPNDARTRIGVSLRSWYAQPFGLAGWWRGRSASRVVGVATNAACLANMSEQSGFLVPPRHIPDGVPAAQPSRLTRGQLLEQLGLPSDAILCGAIGRMIPSKCLKDAIWAADLLKVIRDDVHLLIIGRGTHHARLEKFREQVRIVDKVHFLGERDDIADLLPHLAWLWQPGSTLEQPTAVLETMAAGVPVIASDTPSHRELVVPDETGYLVSLGDRAQLARAANRLLGDHTLSARLGAAARQRAVEHFPAQRTVANYLTWYRELLA